MTNFDDIACVYVTYDSIEADLIKMQLESEGISSFLKSDNAGGMLPYLTTMTGVRIMVHKENEKLASQVINERLEADKHE